MNLTVKALRINAGIKVDQAAKHIGVSYNAYLRKENGQSRFYVDEAVALSKLFGVDEAIFFKAACLKKTRSSA